MDTKTLASLLCLVASSVWAAPAYRNGGDSSQSHCFVDDAAVQARATARLYAAPGAAPAPAASRYRVAMIRVDFSDKPMTLSAQSAEELAARFQSFYLENSYGLLTVTATVSGGGAGRNGAYRMPFPYAGYAAGSYSDYHNLILDAVAVATAAGFNFLDYDHLMIMHSGQGAETTDDSNIWSAYLPTGYLGFSPTVHGKSFPGASIIPSSQGGGIQVLGVLCHEYGHQLGLPDLYDTNTGNTAVGIWSLMDYGTYAGTPPGSNPSHLDAWSKQTLGFVEPETISFSGGAQRLLEAAGTRRSAFVRLPIHNSESGGDKEYFLLEYRKTSGSQYDRGLPGEGLLIWHVDDAIALDPVRLRSNSVNTNRPHRGVALVTADGIPPVYDGGNSGDPWTGRETTSFTAPRSNAFNRKPSGVEVFNVSGTGSTMLAMSVRNFSSNSAVTANSATGGVVVIGGTNGWINPDKNETAYVAAVPVNTGTLGLKILSMNGAVVSEQSAPCVGGQQSLMSWNGTSSDGQTVPSGIYFVQVKGGGLDSMRKVAVIR